MAGNNLSVRDPGVLVDNNMNMSQAAATKANQVLGCIHEGFTSRDKDVVAHCIQHVLGHTRSTMSISGTHHSRKMRIDWRGSKEGPGR